MLAIVARKSTRDEHQVSVTKQEKLGRDWAAIHRPGVPVVVFADNAKSGTDMARPGWVAFTAAVRKGTVTDVWAYEQSRLTRAGSATWDEVCVLLWAAGITHVQTHMQGPIGVMEGNRLQGRILAVVDQEERERVRVRVRDHMNTLAQEGRPSGATGYGYRRLLGDDKRPALEPDEVTAPIVRRMVSEVAAGASLGLVATRLNADGIPTPRGSKVWRRETVKAIVTAPRIVGDRVHQGKVVGPALWPAIVDRETWDRAQQAIGQPKTRAGERRQYLLTGGLAVCAACRTALISSSQPYRGVLRPAYACPHPSRHDGGCGHLSILAERLEAHVVAVVDGWLEAPEFAAALESLFAADQADAAPFRAQLAEVDGRLVELAERWARREVIEVQHAAAQRVLMAERAGLVARLEALPPTVTITADEVRSAWATEATPGRRGLVRLLADLPIRVERGPRRAVAERVSISPRWG